MKQISSKNLVRVTVAVIIVLGALIYSNALQGPFVFDDEPFIVYNTSIKDLGDVPAIWRAAHVPSRFISFLSFAVNYHFHGLDVFGYHLVNVTIHLINALLVYWLMVITLRRGAVSAPFRGGPGYPAPTGSHACIFATAVALLFLTHPLQTQAVTYITQRFTSLATMYYLLTICLYAKGRLDRRPALFWLAAATAVLAMFTKEIAITLPVAVILYEIYFVGARSPRPKTEGRETRPLRWIVILIFLLIIPAVFSFNAADILTIEHHSGSYNGEPINNVTYFLTQFRVIVTYLKLLVCPLGQNLLYEFPASRSLGELSTLLSFLALAGLIAFAVCIRKREPLISFGILWFFLTLSVESSVIVIRHVIFEHRVYLPSVGLFMALVGALYWLMNAERHRAVFTVTMAVVIAACCYLTVERNKVWQTKVALWSDVVRKSPGLLKAHLNLGVAYTDAGNYLEAMKVYDALLTQAPNAEAFSNRGNVYSRLGEHGRAMEDYTKALAINPNSAMAYTNRGDSYYNLGDYEKAVEDYTKAIKVNPEYYLAYGHRGNAYRLQNRLILAENDYNEAIRRNPYEFNPYMGIGISAFSQRDYEKAFDYFSQVIQLDKTNVSALINRANALSELKRFDEAMADYDRAIRLAPKNGQIYYNRGILFRKMGKEDLAGKDLEAAKALGYAP